MADLYSNLGLDEKELNSLQDLALAKLKAAELIKLNQTHESADPVLAERYKSEAIDLQNIISNRISENNQ